MDAAIKEKMVKLFNIAYFIAKEASFTMFPKLVALHQTNGLDLGSTYSNDQACHIFITAIGSCFFEELQQSLKSARFFSIMSDSSVDRSVKDQELIYCTYLQNASVKQVPQLQDIKQTLRAIHKHYTCSVKASRELEEISKAMGGQDLHCEARQH
ncbi:hypothetical protein AAFF_G00365170 [Aldrovandia affinis]|uniref:Uncharacterized protein n=1 Tax=Aldrovandia affinis TaxID=143900 RepID=A0AAD7R567_9TELE|nr:hypothetical protein AAFF_G00365170 [Aldrovandia affinis]